MGGGKGVMKKESGGGSKEEEEKEQRKKRRREEEIRKGDGSKGRGRRWAARKKRGRGKKEGVMKKEVEVGRKDKEEGGKYTGYTYSFQLLSELSSVGLQLESSVLGVWPSLLS